MKKSEALSILSKLISPYYNDKNELSKLMNQLDDWSIVIEVANRYLLIPVLYGALKDKEVFDDIKDKILKEYLFEIYKLNKKRNEAIIFQVNEICESLNEINITPLLLKGVASLSENYYNDIGYRSMVDIDILVSENKIFDSIDKLKNSGYKEIDASYALSKDWHHYKRLYKYDRATSVEVHRQIISKKAIKYITDFETKKSKLFQNALVLTPTFEFFHAFLHSEVAHNYHNEIISLRHLHYGVTILHKYKNEINFKELQDYIKKYNLEKVWNEYLYLLHQLFLIDIPIEIPKMEKYKQYVLKNIDIQNTIYYRSKKISKKVINAFKFDTLQNKFDNLNYRYQMIYYAPIRFVYLSYKFITDKNKRKSILS